jgi:hypothetical protein
MGGISLIIRSHSFRDSENGAIRHGWHVRLMFAALIRLAMVGAIPDITTHVARRRLATVTALPDLEQPRGTRRPALQQTSWLLGCTAAAFLMLGYHPYAEDGGIYSTGVALRLHPELFPAEHGLAHSFAVAHTSQSLFVPTLAALVRLLHLPQDVVMLLVFVASLFATLCAAAALASVLFPSLAVQRWAVLLLAVSLGLPVAGTSLYLADPYLTSRSLWMPLMLWGLALLLRKRVAAGLTCLAVTLPFHPLMAALTVLLYGAVLARRSARPVAYPAGLAALALAGMAAVQWLAPVDSEAVRAASLSRGYWFLSQWEWFEVVGLIAAPVLLVAFATYRPVHARCTSAARDLAWALCTIAATTALAAVLLIHTTNAGFLLARLQPLRLMHPLYLIFVLLMGGVLADIPLRQSRRGWAAAVACVVAAAGLLLMQRGIYDSSGHWEIPGIQPLNRYEQAFLWIRANTPLNAVFATDANYTTATGEDAHMLRAIALRTALPDAAKDGGIASVVPPLADQWKRGSDLQTGLVDVSDAERLQRVRSLGATWIVLPVKAATAFPCPYQNDVAKVCRLP